MSSEEPEGGTPAPSVAELIEAMRSRLTSTKPVDALPDEGNRTSKKAVQSADEAAKKEQLKDIRSDRKLREDYAKWLVWILASQLLFLAVVLVLVGSHVLTLDPITIRYFIVGVLGEIFGLVATVTHSLFGATSSRRRRN
jgi:hypothetical protein